MRPYAGMEHRKFKRRKFRLGATFRIVNGRDASITSSPQKGIVVDISVGGVQMLVKSPQADGMHITGQVMDNVFVENQLLIEFRLDYKDRRSMKFVGQFVRYDRQDLSGEYRFAIGVRYLDISKEDLERVKEFLESRLQEEPVRRRSLAPHNKG